jgi:formylglycine-generating enzyme required for sulfatase activity
MTRPTGMRPGIGMSRPPIATRNSSCALLVAVLLVLSVGQPPGSALGRSEKSVDLPGGATMEFVWIEPGAFLMGSQEPSEDGQGCEGQHMVMLTGSQPELDGDCYYDENEGPQHEVAITRGFWLGKDETTQEQWQSVMATTPWSGRGTVREGADSPAVAVSWHDIQAFVVALNASYVTEVFRLPTEAEWEYACRAGTTTQWSFGNDEGNMIDHSWYRDALPSLLEQTDQTGSRLPNPWGLFDMHGDACEWVEDWYGVYSEEPQVDPQGPASGERKVFRGGYFRLATRHSRSAERFFATPSSMLFRVGARIVMAQ